MSQPKKKVPNSSRAKYLRQRAISTSLITGPGIFFTCPRNKEAASVYELKDLLERVAEEIKPAVVGEDEPQGDQSKGTEVEEEDEDEKVEDIESQIQKELEELKGGGRRDDRGAKKQVTRRFESKKMDCECLGFISFPKAYDPVEFSTHIVRQIQEGKSGYGLRFIQRITPVSMTCSANSPTEFEKILAHLLEPHFGIKASPEIKANEAEVSVPIPDAGPAICPRVGLRFRIEPIIRCHDKPLNRSEVIRITGDVVKRFNGDEYIVMADECSVGHQTSDLLHRVSIDDAQVVILVCVYRYVVGVSVVRDYDKDGKRFNLRVLAETQEKEAVTAE
ncbi:hypothetical protein MJO28_013679 [Puccinia striiformis f. sp. tritici]|nr:hypothetical protein Pst134EA_025809 [Puccinia striiformis f. sp. tritici]XP_047800173.1 hypothetical protein Pst134EA_025823 [Puccinia striiformis f. sp. tritici]KAI9599731.1 hypothetical protein KEM48_011192 [Puccinia striiformis f. sp. tritici PST-130]POW14524.1 hypothetical protein PSTT_02892 [Puccinia striiformis]KAH9451868.1 hypothetical protein Pst134EA_025809 [Puccinia striiformis f. sp. tritici]KAH9451882.1 hypothetical protein Pst134EA_025823 [Puccinia striiformis f. sp. tritici]